MVQVQSKFIPIFETCDVYAHPFNPNCLQNSAATLIHAAYASAKLYTLVYVLTLIMRGKFPNKQDLKKTLYGILQSTAFLSGTGFGYSLFLCTLRKLLGHFNILTVSAIPVFLASVFAILIERPSRRILLCLYVSNVATETLWNMALSRNMVRSVNYGATIIFSTSMALLLRYYKGGQHKRTGDSTDSMFGVLRFVVGECEEKDYTLRSSQASSFYRQQMQNSRNEYCETSNVNLRKGSRKPSSKNMMFHLIQQALRVYKRIIQKLKCCDRHQACPHPFSCLYYVLQGTGKMFSVGFGIQLTLKLVLNMKRLFKSPKLVRTILMRKDTLNLALFLGGFSGIFRAVLCALRWITGKNDPSHAIPAGLLAGVAFTKYPDTTVALYVMWKAAQISYTIGMDKGYLPKVPGFTEFLYCFSTAVLFHAAILEPTNLRPSYWKFLHSISGGRIACMSREPLDVWGLNTTKSLATVLEQTKTSPTVQFLC